MSDTDVTSDAAGTPGDEERPVFLPPPTYPSAMLADDGPAEGDGADVMAAPPPVAPPADEAPARSSLLIRLGHLFCGRPNGAR